MLVVIIMTVNPTVGPEFPDWAVDVKTCATKKNHIHFVTLLYLIYKATKLLSQL